MRYAEENLSWPSAFRSIYELCGSLLTPEFYSGLRAEDGTKGVTPSFEAINSIDVLFLGALYAKLSVTPKMLLAGGMLVACMLAWEGGNVEAVCAGLKNMIGLAGAPSYLPAKV